MSDKFKKFLIEHNCLEQYIKNIKYLNNHTDFDKFKWMDTPEGYEYWSELYSLWMNNFTENIVPEKSKIYVYQYCLLSNNNRYSSGFLEHSRITSAKDAIDFKEKLCENLKLNEKNYTLISLNIIGEKDE